MLAPNKQNLLLLKATLKSQENGHRLLKEKRSGLILVFLQLAKNGKELESKVFIERQNIVNYYLNSVNLISLTALNQHLNVRSNIQLKPTKKKLSGVSVANFEAVINIDQPNNLKFNIATSLNKFNILFPELIKLSQIKINCQNLSLEIKKVNRQISNLEQKINSTKADLKYMKQNLDEKSNLEKATLIKIFS